MFDSFSRSETSGWTVVIGVPGPLCWPRFGAGWGGRLQARCCCRSPALAWLWLMARKIAGSIKGLIAPALAVGRGEPVALEHLELVETNEVGESLLKASDLIQQRAAERERAENARREAEDLKRLNAALESSEAAARTLAAELAADMAERKEAEEALRKSEAGLAAAQRIAHIGSWEWETRNR